MRADDLRHQEEAIRRQLLLDSDVPQMQQSPPAFTHYPAIHQQNANYGMGMPMQQPTGAPSQVMANYGMGMPMQQSTGAPPQFMANYGMGMPMQQSTTLSGAPPQIPWYFDPLFAFHRAELQAQQQRALASVSTAPASLGGSASEGQLPSGPSAVTQTGSPDADASILGGSASEGQLPSGPSAVTQTGSPDADASICNPALIPAASETPVDALGDHHDSDNSQSDPSDSESDSPQKKKCAPLKNQKNRIRPSLAKPLHGLVEGAMRGNKPYEVPRLKELKTTITERGKATRRFNREISRIFSRCEALAEETGCWLMLGGHAGGNTSAVHYSSASLRLDARADTTAMLNQFMNTTGRLKQASFVNAGNLLKRLAAKEAELTAIKDAIAESQKGAEDIV